MTRWLYWAPLLAGATAHATSRQPGSRAAHELLRAPAPEAPLPRAETPAGIAPPTSAMVRALRRVQARASTVTAEELGAADPHTASPLPLFERLKREHGVHDRHHPQRYISDRRPGSSVGGSSDGGDSWRRAQESEGTLTEETTQPLRIQSDFSAMYPETALQYSTCFEVGQWFKWNFPESSDPPCETAHNWWGNDPLTWESWVQSNQDSCGGGGSDVYAPGNRGHNHSPA